MMEGLSSEAASLAGTLRLGRSRSSSTTPTRSRSRPRRTSRSPRTSAGASRRAAGTCSTSTATDVDAVDAALRSRARRRGPPVADRRAHAHRLRQPEETGHVRARTASRSAPTRCAPPSAPLGWPEEPPFHLPEEALRRLSRRRSNAAPSSRPPGGERVDAYRAAHSRTRPTRSRGRSPASCRDGWQDRLPVVHAGRRRDGHARRRRQGADALAGVVTNLIGGSADLDPSTKHGADRTAATSKALAAARRRTARRRPRARPAASGATPAATSISACASTRWPRR